MWLLVKLREEGANRRTYLLRVRFQRKVAGIVEMDFGTRVVALERFGAQGQEKPITLAPNREHRRPLCPEIFLELGIERYVARVIEEQVKLDLVIAGPGQQRRIEFVRFRSHQRH